jgi:phosphoglycerol transferase MdoB-like AlkP superfamily enzyme
VTSQLDVAPTVLGLLNLSHDSAFFGRDVLTPAAARHAVPLNHNRDVALLTGDRLNQLGFRKTAASVTHGSLHQDEAHDAEGLRDAASVFQLGYSLYSRRQYGVR